MSILIKSKENFTAKELFNLTKSSNIQKMSEHANEIIDIESYVIYDKADYETGEMKKVLAIKPVGQPALATNSPTCIQEFEELYNMFAETGELNELKKIQIIAKTSKKGRRFITCALVD